MGALIRKMVNVENLRRQQDKRWKEVETPRMKETCAPELQGSLISRGVASFKRWQKAWKGEKGMDNGKSILILLQSVMLTTAFFVPAVKMD